MKNMNCKGAKHVVSVTVNKNDMRFYRKRIYDLTKSSLSSNAKPLSSDIQMAFDRYINACIEHFKISDSNDINQSDYDKLSNETNDSPIDICAEQIKEDADKLMMRSVNIKNASLDKFVTRIKKKTTIILPRTKEINLKDPSLMNKGIVSAGKKKNITSKYEETNSTKIVDETNIKDEQKKANKETNEQISG